VGTLAPCLDCRRSRTSPGGDAASRAPRGNGSVSRWTRDVLCASLVGGALLGCRARPPRPREDAFLDTRAPVARLDSVVEAADTVRLRLADARTLLGV